MLGSNFELRVQGFWGLILACRVLGMRVESLLFSLARVYIHDYKRRLCVLLND